ncbi:MAG: Type II secretion system protein [Thermotogales bacterium 46_20]|nr:MAG: Type II secretion system protein [Thermotogales bacterium 46_20]
MADYRYQVINKKGKTESGKIAANSQMEALQLLTSQGFVVTSIKPVKKHRSKSRTALFPISVKEVSLFSRQLSTMVSAGVRIRDAVQVLSVQPVFSRRFRKVLTEVVLLIEGGMSFSEAMEHTRVFDSLFINLVKAGEAGGVLDEALLRVADFYESMVDLQQQVKSAMAYPLFMMVFAVMIVMVISLFILPNLISAFGSDAPMTGVMGLLLSMNELLMNHWLPIVIGVVFALVGGKIFLKTKYGRMVKDVFASIIPPVKRLRTMTAVERFTRTLAVLVSSGVDIPTALNLSSEVSESNSIVNAIVRAIEEIRAGETIHGALQKQGVFPPIVISMVETGEETGKLDTVMFKVADFYRNQVQAALKQLISLVEPMMILFIGGFVAFLAYTMYSSIFALQQTIG